MRRTLILHPDSVCIAARRIEVEIARPRGDRLVLSYIVAGKIGGLRLPPAAAATRADELWRQTCFEAFVRPAPAEAYYEFNFAPSTQWAAYRFDGYRSGMRVATEIGAPQITVQSAPERYILQAALELPGAQSSPAHGEAAGGRAWRLNLSAVIEEGNGRKSYWALAHPEGKPDFHHADCFALALSEG
jgi:hypothetical protein